MTRKRTNRKDRLTCYLGKNLKMNPEVYALRRQVMDVIYKAKELVPELPRLDVRIIEGNRHNILGVAQSGDCVIWIPENSLTNNVEFLPHVVLHEICHAVWSAPHDNDCPLMSPYLNLGEPPMTWEQLSEAFLGAYQRCSSVNLREAG